MAKVETGGPAFPERTQAGHDADGMRLRDYFAGQALARLAPSLGDDVDADVRHRLWLRAAAHCYAIADAMIAVRG